MVIWKCNPPRLFTGGPRERRKPAVSHHCLGYRTRAIAERGHVSSSFSGLAQTSTGAPDRDLLYADSCSGERAWGSTDRAISSGRKRLVSRPARSSAVSENTLAISSSEKRRLMIVSSAMGLGGLVRDWSGAENVGAKVVPSYLSTGDGFDSEAAVRWNRITPPFLDCLVLNVERSSELLLSAYNANCAIDSFHSGA